MSTSPMSAARDPDGQRTVHVPPPICGYRSLQLWVWYAIRGGAVHILAARLRERTQGQGLYTRLSPYIYLPYI